MKKTIYASVLVAMSLFTLSCSNDEEIITSIPHEASKVENENKMAKKSAYNNVQRFYSLTLNKHFYGVNVAPPGSSPNTVGWAFESNMVTLNNSFSFGGSAVFSLYKNGDNLLTINVNEYNSAINNGYVLLETLGYSAGANNYPIYRYFSQKRGEHFYTNNFNELGNGSLGFVYEGIAFYGENYPF